jgi:hypothetical protein
MQLSAVLLARVVYFVESVDLNPRGGAYYPDLIHALVERYQFKGFPQKLEDYDESKGVSLIAGKYGDRTIAKVTIYNWGLTLDTTSSTTDAEELLVDALKWATANLKLHYAREMIKRKYYVSQFIFYSDVPLLSLNPALDTIADRVSKEVSQHLKLPYVFQTSGTRLSIDPEAQRIPVLPLTIERREGIAFSENKYFSSAPLSTDTHVSVIDEFERSMRQHSKTFTIK